MEHQEAEPDVGIPSGAWRCWACEEEFPDDDLGDNDSDLWLLQQ